MKYYTALLALTLVVTACSNKSGSSIAPNSNSSGNGAFELDVSKLASSDTNLSLNAATANLNFGSVSPSAPNSDMDVTLKNNSAAAIVLTFDPIALPFVMKVNHCPASMPAGGSCVFTMGFIGRNIFNSTVSGNLILNSAITGNKISLPLTAIVTGSVDSSTVPASLSATFSGFVAAGSSYFAEVVMSNAGPGPVASITPALPAGYVMWLNRCSGPLLSGKSCSMIIYNPAKRAGSVPTGLLSIGATHSAGALLKEFDISSGASTNAACFANPQSNVSCIGYVAPWVINTGTITAAGLLSTTYNANPGYAAGVHVYAGAACIGIEFVASPFTLVSGTSNGIINSSSVNIGALASQTAISFKLSGSTASSAANSNCKSISVP